VCAFVFLINLFVYCTYFINWCKGWEKAESLEVKTRILPRRGELKRFVNTFWVFKTFMPMKGRLGKVMNDSWDLRAYTLMHVTAIYIYVNEWTMYGTQLKLSRFVYLIISPYPIISVLYIWYDTIAKLSSLQIVSVVWCIVCCVVFCSGDVLMLYSIALYYCVALTGFIFRAVRRIWWIYETRYVNK
jgi:hypothetical protein